ncbi:HD domain-containing protein [Oceanobacillus alkalisoli]|uniref:HD domain-containing protein n=1 Tax=Oceanobacillus alkalisoli TaxID=2925113 RepID=UPI001EF00592|nr:HD domain-containing protein [Oceanobacillus alkalisoli]MCF3942025.1 HD domain-containing protein [Oceanobacillus alkalisoli]MCG5102022.1 HD domain-containing protein [Oceanobacillus alkalisoli]
MNEQQDYFYGVIPVEVQMTPERKEQILEQYPAPALPDEGATFEIDQEEKGNSVSLRLLLNEVKVQTTKTNNQFLKMTFSNNAGNINAKMWDNQGAVEKNLPLLEAHSIFDVDAVVDEFRGFKSLTVKRLEPCEGEIDPFSYLPYTKQSIEDYTIEIFSYIDELSSPYREFSLAVIDQFWQEFSISPAAKGFHHNYLGGLLKHTVGLMRFARYILKQEENSFQAVMKLIQIVEKAYKQELWANYEATDKWVRPVWQDAIDHLYQMLAGMMEHKEEVPNYNALLTSILLHDIGKMLEYDFAGKKYDAFSFLYPTADKSSLQSRKQTGITMDELGLMVGHIPYGTLILTKMVEQTGTPFTIEDIHLLSHCILCHHGLPEWGASVKPQTIEGYLIHIVDYLDSRYENTETVK